MISLNENSSTSLIATFDGTPLAVDNTGPDHWTVTLPAPIEIGVFDIEAWREAEDQLLLNKAFRGASSTIWQPAPKFLIPALPLLCSSRFP